MDDVYIVTDGQYSDYRICAVFDNEASAKEHVAAKGGDAIATHRVYSDAPARTTWWVIDTIAWDHAGHPFERPVVMWDYEGPVWAGKPYRYMKWNQRSRRVFGTDLGRVRKVFWDNYNQERAAAEGVV